MNRGISMMLLFALAGCERKTEGAGQERKKTLDDWYNAVPERARADYETPIAEKLPNGDKDPYWQVGNDISDAGKGRTMDEYVPVFLKALKKEKGKRAAALLHAIKVKTALILVMSEDDLVSLNGLIVETASTYVEDPERDARLAAVSLLKQTAHARIHPKSKKVYQSLSESALAELRKACEKAAKDLDEKVQNEAKEALEALEK